MRRVLQRLGLAGSIALLALPAGMAADNGSPFAKLVQSKLVHCAFYKAYEVDSQNGDLLLVEGRSNSLTHFQGIEGGHARQISTRMAGARDVRVIQTAKYLHFVDQVAGMYLLTTVYGCIDERDGVCGVFGAVQSRNFDARSLHDPDAVYEALKDSSDPGFCDHSFIGIREATKR
jgi:hypothetical protein